MKRFLIAACAASCAGLAQAQDGAPRIDEIVWPGIDSYCSFMRADHVFVFDDPSTWRWVLFSNYPEFDGPEPLDAPFMRIDGQLKQLEQTKVEETENGTRRSYVTHDAEPYEVVLTLLPGPSGAESSAFSGSIAVSRNGATGSVDFKGDCGV